MGYLRAVKRQKVVKESVKKIKIQKKNFVTRKKHEIPKHVKNFPVKPLLQFHGKTNNKNSNGGKV